MKRFIYKYTRVICLSLFFAAGALLFAEESVPNGYGGVTLGMSVDSTKDALKQNSDFGYHGDRDVSLVPGTEDTLIETDTQRGHVVSFLDRCYFQFNNDALYIITINVNPSRVDYFSMLDTLIQKYGKPTNLNPQIATWKGSGVTMTLERPLTLKYIDDSTFESLNSSSNVEKSGGEKTKDAFLGGL